MVGAHRLFRKTGTGGEDFSFQDLTLKNKSVKIAL